MKNINKTLFFYFILKTDNKLNIISKSNKTYFNSLKNNYFGNIETKIVSKDGFLILLQNNIDMSLIDFTDSKITFNLEKDCFENINPKYIGKKLEFNITNNEHNIKAISVVFESKEFLI